MNYDDHNISEINENQLITSNAYILVYKIKCNTDKLDYESLINNLCEELKENVKLNRESKSLITFKPPTFTNGEPVQTTYGRGYILEGNKNYIYYNILKIKLRSGIGFLK